MKNRGIRNGMTLAATAIVILVVVLTGCASNSQVQQARQEAFVEKVFDPSGKN